MNAARLDKNSSEITYNSSVYCNCFNTSTNVKLYGTFWEATGTCPECGVVFIAKQIPIDAEGNTRYVVKREETIKSITGEWVTLLSS